MCFKSSVGHGVILAIFVKKPKSLFFFKLFLMGHYISQTKGLSNVIWGN